jgi:hypothetical protein
VGVKRAEEVKKERKRKDPRRDRPLMEKTESVIRRTIMNAFDLVGQGVCGAMEQKSGLGGVPT